MLVDDDESILELFKELIETQHISVCAACSGEEALKLLQQIKRVDAIVSDFKMPGIDGITLKNKIAEMGLSYIPFILVSGIFIPDRDNPDAAPYDAFIPKIEFQDNLDIIRNQIKTNREKLSILFKLLTFC